MLRESSGPPRTRRSLVGFLLMNNWKAAVSGMPKSRQDFDAHVQEFAPRHPDFDPPISVSCEGERITELPIGTLLASGGASAPPPTAEMGSRSTLLPALLPIVLVSTYRPLARMDERSEEGP